MGKIRLYLDESVDIRIAEGLKRRGVEVYTVRDTSNLGLSDEEQLEYARKNGFVIFTHDIDFLKLAAQWSKEGKSHAGIIYTHQQSHSLGECIRLLKLITELLTREEMINHIEFI